MGRHFCASAYQALRASWPAGDGYGPITDFDRNAPGNVWSGNRWDDGTSRQYHPTPIGTPRCLPGLSGVPPYRLSVTRLVARGPPPVGPPLDTLSPTGQPNLEDANGGTGDVAVQNNWIYGGAFSVMMDARNTKLLGNQLGGDIHWNTCYLGTRVGNAGLVSTGNTRDGQPINLCQ